MQNTETGGMSLAWVPFAVDVPASVEPLSAREFIAASAGQAEVIARVVLRWRDDLDATMQILHGDEAYDITGVLPDKKSGREYITIPVTQGVRDG